jgi:ferredoxin
MTFVVTENCRLCRYTDCIAVCPVSCFHGDGEMLYIDPARCIDCGACIPECPVEAIYEEGTVPPESAHWLAINAERAAKLPVISEREPALPSAAARARELGFLPIE